MDNIFVPNFTFTFEQSEKIIAECPIPVDSHLMIADPDERAHLYARAGSASVTFHYEASSDPLKTISRIKDEGARVGLALKPATPFHEISSLMEHLDMVLIMTVEPGFGGQSFMHDMMGKVKEARKEIDSRFFGKIWLQIDGGVSLETIPEAAEAGADTFVAGSAVFKSENPGLMVDSLRSLATKSQTR
jgi:ribulose-phosphate 3-epimerase